MNGNAHGEEETYLITQGAAMFECMSYDPARIAVRVRWNMDGPDHLAGRPACEVDLFPSKIVSDDSKAFVRLEDGVEVDDEFIRHVCLTYGLRGGVEVEMVRRKFVQRLGFVKVR